MMFAALARGIDRHRGLTLGLSGAYLAVALLLLLRGGSLTSGTIDGLEADEAQREADGVTGRPLATTVVTVLEGRGGAAAPGTFARDVTATLAPLRRDPRVQAVVAPDDLPGPIAQTMLAPSRPAALALITLRGGLQQALRAYPAVRDRLRAGKVAATTTGYVPFIHDLDRALERDLVRAELISLPLALLVLLLVFGTAVAAVLPVGVGSLAVAGGLAIVFALSHALAIAQYTINVCTLIGLGVAIDYSLFLVSRYREELAAGREPREALAQAMERAGRVIVFSGAAVATGLGGLLFFDGSYLRSMGIGGAVVVALAVVFALTFMPALLAVLGPRIHAGRLPALLPERVVDGGRRVVRRLAARPVLLAVPALAALVALGLPALHLRLAAADVGALPPETDARRGLDRLAALFPDQAANRILVAVRFPTAPALTAERIGALFDRSRAIGRLPGVRKVESVVDAGLPLPRAAYQELLLHPPAAFASLVAAGERFLVGDRTVLLYAITDAGTHSAQARALVRAIRRDRRLADGTVLVGGQTASDLDTTAYVLSHAPRAAAFVVVATLVVLFLLFGSLLLPLQAVVASFLSVAAAFGALVWSFEDGHLLGGTPGPLEPALPVLLFCALFGLSMDYEVLMLSRMRESWLRTGDNGRAVLEGRARAAGLIVSAAAIMVAVFGAFALADVVLLRAVGFGMAIAVAIDALLVRLVLVPALMRLCGRANWWIPRPLAALRRRLGFDGEAP